MLEKTRRLTRQKDFEKVFKQGRSSYSKALGVKVLANQLKNNRYGIIISTKVSKKSTDRNKLKRQIRQAVRLIDNRLVQGLDLAITVLPAMLGQEYMMIKSELERILIKLKLLK